MKVTIYWKDGHSITIPFANDVDAQIFIEDHKHVISHTVTTWE